MAETITAEGKLRTNSVGVFHIVFFVVGTAAPLTSVVGATPAAFAFGNGAGVSGVFLMSGLLYFVFSIGFTAMSRFVSGAGAFYTYIAQGLGKPLGVGSALIAVLTYSAAQIATYALLGLFFGDLIKPLGISLPWWSYSMLAVLIVTYCGRRNVTFSGNLLGVCMLAEIAILLLLDFAIIWRGGAEGINFHIFAPSVIFGPSVGTSLVFVIGSYMGFEATAVYSEEARNPERTIPRATFMAVLLITGFYTFSTWAITEYYGESNIAFEAKSHVETLYFGPTTALLGGATTEAMRILLVASLFACVLSLHNTINRYFFALGREGILLRKLGKVHPVHNTPAIAGLAQSLIVIVTLTIFAIGGQDPYAIVFSWMAALAVMGILCVQALVCAAVVAFFKRDSRAIGVVKRLIAPVVSGIGLIIALGAVIANLAILSGSNSPIVTAFPYLIGAVGLTGIAIALWFKYRRPIVYASLGRVFESS